MDIKDNHINYIEFKAKDLEENKGILYSLFRLDFYGLRTNLCSFFGKRT